MRLLDTCGSLCYGVSGPRILQIQLFVLSIGRFCRKVAIHMEEEFWTREWCDKPALVPRSVKHVRGMHIQRRCIRNRVLSLKEREHSRILCEAKNRRCRRTLQFVFGNWWNTVATLSSLARSEHRSTRERMVGLFQFRLQTALKELYVYKNVPHPKEDCIAHCRICVEIENEKLRLWGGDFYSEDELAAYFK